MNFHSAMGITYMAAIIVAAIPVALVLLTKHRKITGTYRYLLVTAICLLLINVLYFLIDYYSVITSYYKTGAIIRVLDIWLAVTMQFSWYMFLMELLFKDKYSALWQTVKYGYVLSLAISMINYGWILDDGYFVGNNTLKPCAVVMDLAVSLFLTTINIACIILIARKLLAEGKPPAFEKITLAATVLITADGIQNTKFALSLIVGHIALYQYGDGGINATAIIRLLFGMCLLWYAIKYCLSGRPTEQSDEATKEKLELLTSETGLTEREKDIVKLLCEGATYQDMADRLYISKNTVKHHVTNVYRKLGVNSKEEMIDIFRQKTKQK